MRNSIYLLVLFIIISSSCKKEDIPAAILINKELKGYVQKGPFITGSRITIQELNDSLIPTGKIFETFTIDDLGTFELPVNLSSRYIEIFASGFYYNEIWGQLSDAQLTLRSLADVTNSNSINVNILTTLSCDRLRYLVQKKGKSYSDANIQVKDEILKIFNITNSATEDFTKMNISEDGSDNAILLAISTIMQQGNSTAELSEIVSLFNLDIKEDGILTNSFIIDEIITNTVNQKLSLIRANLEKRYGSSYTIPNFEKYAKRLIDPVYLNLPIDIKSNLLFHFSPNGGNDDLSGNGKTINPVNCGLTSDRFGTPGKAYSISLTDTVLSYISLPIGRNLSEPGWTYSLWAKVDKMGAWDEPYLLANSIFSGDFDDVYLAFDSRQESSDPCFGTIGCFVDDYFSSSIYDIEKSTWFHCVVTYESGLIRIYVNGSLVLNSQKCFCHQFSGTTYEISSSARKGGRFAGAVSNICFYTRVLNISEVKELYNAN